MNKKYKVGLVGYGYIGRSHVNTIISLNKYFELKVIFENKMIKKNIDELPRNVKIYKEFTRYKIFKILTCNAIKIVLRTFF